MPDPASLDTHYMQQALSQAAKGLGRTSPNPPVGCVIVNNGQVVGRGFHPKAGQPHAEVFALKEAADQAHGATAYVTLEPCSHYGRTPPCAVALIQAGVARVVVAAGDPNPQVNGRGLAMLKEAGVAVSTGVLESQAIAQQAGFRSLIMRGRPYVVYKYAMTLDGKVAAAGEANGAVSGKAARELLMQWRNEFDAIAVGAGTVLLDNPRLTTRGIVGGRDPRPVIFDRSDRLSSRVSSVQALRPESVVVGSNPKHPQAIVLRPQQALNEALEQLSQRYQVSTLLLEGGPSLASEFFAAGLIDEVRVFVATKMLGAGLSPLVAPTRTMTTAATLTDITIQQLDELGGDVLICGKL